jgi:hypothetical protein
VRYHKTPIEKVNRTADELTRLRAELLAESTNVAEEVNDIEQ